MRLIRDRGEVAECLFDGWLGKDFAFDVETTGLNPRQDLLLGIALRFADGESAYVALRHTEPRDDGYPLVTYMEQGLLAQAIRPLFLQRDAVMVGHNAKFDLHFLDAAGIEVRGRLFDTMLAAQMLDENRASLSLKELAPLELGLPLDRYQDLAEYPGFPKDSILAVPLGSAATYALGDVEATWGLYEKYRLALPEDGLDWAFNQIWMPLCYTLFEMERRGIATDRALVEEARARYVAQAAEHEAEIWREGMRMVAQHEEPPAQYLRMAYEVLPDLALDEHPEVESVEHQGVAIPVLRKWSKNGKQIGRTKVPWFNPNSRDQLAELLFGWLGLSLPTDVRLKKTETGKTSVDADALKVMRLRLGEESPPLLDHVLALRKASKFVGTYLDNFVELGDPDDHWAIHTTFNQAQVETGRLSSSHPNLQNISARGEEGKLARRMFVPRPGHVFVVADYSQMELRMLAHYSSDEALLDAFEQGKDLHVLTGARQGGMTYDELLALVAAGDPEGKKLRSIGKTSNFALTYGMAAPRYQLRLLVDNGLWVPLSQAKQWIKDYNATYEGATRWKKRVIDHARGLGGYATSIAGRKRRLPDLFDPDSMVSSHAERAAVNYVIQGGCADVMNFIASRVQAAVAPLGASLLLIVHDEIVLEVPERYAQTAKRITETLLGDLANEQFNLRCPLIAEAHVGLNWADAKQ